MEHWRRAEAPSTTRVETAVTPSNEQGVAKVYTGAGTGKSAEADSEQDVAATARTAKAAVDSSRSRSGGDNGCSKRSRFCNSFSYPANS